MCELTDIKLKVVLRSCVKCLKTLQSICYLCDVRIKEPEW